MMEVDGIKLKGFDKMPSRHIAHPNQQRILQKSANAVFGNKDVKGAIKELAKQ